MGKTLFVTDLDGTLLSADSLVSRASAEMLNKAISEGALFSIATARTPSTVERLMSGVDCRLPFIVMTGAAMWNPADKTFSQAVTMSPPTAREVFDITKSRQLPAFVYCLRDGRIHIYHSGPLSAEERLFISQRSDSVYKVFHIPADGCSEIPDPLTDVSLFYSMQAAAIVEPAYKEIKESVECNPVFYHDIFDHDAGIMEVFSPEASKANAVRRLKEMTGADRVVAFGDNINDIPMLREADTAVAVENAVEEVKRMADVIIGPNTTDSVARFILSATSKFPYATL